MDTQNKEYQELAEKFRNLFLKYSNLKSKNYIDEIEHSGLLNKFNNFLSEYTITEKELKKNVYDADSKTLDEKLLDKELKSAPFANYKLIKEIGYGGMGIVYKAEHLESKKIVALKILRSDSLITQKHMQMFHREISVLSTIQHSNVISIYDVGVFKERHYFTMEYIDGCTLEDFMSSFGDLRKKQEEYSLEEVVIDAQNKADIINLSEEATGGKPNQQIIRIGKFRALNLALAFKITKSILSAISCIHEKGSIHRDIKPSNIIMKKNGEPILMDFGLARNINHKEGNTLTQAGVVWGTPAYMSPEQALGDPSKLSEISDIYSIGAMFYELLSGRPPFVSNGEPLEDIKNFVENEPKSLRKVNKSIPKKLEYICNMAMNKKSDKRYATAKSFEADIDRYIDGKKIFAKPENVFIKFYNLSIKSKFLSISIIFSFILLASLIFNFNKTDKFIKETDKNININQKNKKDLLQFLENLYPLISKDTTILNEYEKILDMYLNNMTKDEIVFFYTKLVLLAEKNKNKRSSDKYLNKIINIRKLKANITKE